MIKKNREKDELFIELKKKNKKVIKSVHIEINIAHCSTILNLKNPKINKE
jgi:hypothetical protein